MNIVVVNDTGYVDGGAAQVAIAPLNELAELGHNVTFVAHHGPFAEQINRTSVKLKALSKSHEVSNFAPIRFFSGLFNVVTLIKLLWFLRSMDRRETIVHFHSWTKYLSSSPLLACRILKLRSVITLHDYFTACPNGGFFDYKKMQICNAKPMGPQCLTSQCDSRNWTVKIYRIVRQIIQNNLVRLPQSVSAYISISDYSERILRKHLPPGIRIFRVHNPIIMPKAWGPGLAPSCEQATHRDKFTFAGRLSTEKGPEVFLKAARLAGVRPTIVGDGALAERLRLDYPEAEFLGWRSPPELQEILKRSVAIVFPSLWHETQGLVVLEAKACGTPAIVSRDCAAAELVKDRETGVIFSSGDVTDLANKLAILRSDAELAMKMSIKCHTTFASDHDKSSSYTQNLINVYHEILKT